jgi:hypothetical protein
LSVAWSAGRDPLDPELEKGNCEAELGVMGEPELDVCIVRGVVAAEGDSERACDIERVEEGDLSRAVRRGWRGCKRSVRRAACELSCWSFVMASIPLYEWMMGK